MRMSDELLPVRSAFARVIRLTRASAPRTDREVLREAAVEARQAADTLLKELPRRPGRPRTKTAARAD